MMIQQGFRIHKLTVYFFSKYNYAYVQQWLTLQLLIVKQLNISFESVNSNLI